MSDTVTQPKFRVLPFNKLHVVHQGRVLQHWPNGHRIAVEGIVLELVSRNLNKDTLTFTVYAVAVPEKENSGV